MYIHGATECTLLFITFVYMEEMADNNKKNYQNGIILDIQIKLVDNKMVFTRFHLANHVNSKFTLDSSHDYNDSSPVGTVIIIHCFEKNRKRRKM